MVIQQDEKDKQAQIQKEKLAKEKRIELKNFQIMQIAGDPMTEGTSANFSTFSPLDHMKKKNLEYEGMSLEEIRLNKNLLRKISH